MKKLVLLAAALAIAASPALAAAKKKKMTKEEEENAKIAQEHDNTRRALRDGLPLVLPSWAIPIYFGTHMDEKMKEGDKPQKKKKQKKMEM
jgi:opacity protein-like surface antigen